MVASVAHNVPTTDRYPRYDEQVRQRLQDAAISCVRELGFRKVSMRHIAERSGLVRQTVYNYYPNKYQLLSEAFVREGTLFAEAIAAHIRDVGEAQDQFVEAFLYVVEQFSRNPILALVLAPDSDFLARVGMTYYPFGPFGQIAFAQVFTQHPRLAAQSEEIAEYWTRNALSFLTMRGATERSREELAEYVRRRLLPGLDL